MPFSGTDPELYITEYTLVYEDKMFRVETAGSDVQGSPAFGVGAVDGQRETSLLTTYWSESTLSS